MCEASSPGGLAVNFRTAGEEIINIDRYSGTLSEVMFIFMATGIALGGFLWLIWILINNGIKSLVPGFCSMACIG